MLCLNDRIPVELVVQVLQKLDDNDIISVAEAGIVDLSNTLISEYIARRIKLIAIIKSRKDGGYRLIPKYSWIIPSHVTKLRVIEGKVKVKEKQYLSSINISTMESLKSIHITHNNGSNLIQLLINLPINIEIVEIKITKAIKGKVKESFKIRNPSTLKMLTIVNTCIWNQRRVCKSVGWTSHDLRVAVQSGVRHESNLLMSLGARGVSNSMIINPFTNPNTNPVNVNVNKNGIIRNNNSDNESMLIALGNVIGKMIILNKESVQNIGVFGVDVLWVFKILLKEKEPIKLSNIRLVRVGGDSMARMSIWTSSILNGSRRLWERNVRMKPMAVVFSPMLHNHDHENCKIVGANGNAVLVAGSGYKLFKEYTYYSG